MCVLGQSHIRNGLLGHGAATVPITAVTVPISSHVGFETFGRSSCHGNIRVKIAAGNELEPDIAAVSDMGNAAPISTIWTP